MSLRRGSALVMLALALPGCAEQDIMPYLGRVAQTALECQAAYEGAKERQSSTVVYAGGASLGAAIIGNAIGKGMVSGMTASQYKSCLARVANTPLGTAAAPAPVAVAPAVPRAVAPAKPATSTIQTGHRACRNTMVGGDGYACMPI